MTGVAIEAQSGVCRGPGVLVNEYDNFSDEFMMNFFICEIGCSSYTK